MIDLDALEAKARAATPGPWEYANDDGYGRDNIYAPMYGLLAQGVGDSGQAEANAAYIAALNPVVAFALIARIRELEAALAPFVALHEQHDVRWPEDADDCAMYRIGSARLEAGHLREAARISKEAADGK